MEKRRYRRLPVTVMVGVLLAGWLWSFIDDAGADWVAKNGP